MENKPIHTAQTEAPKVIFTIGGIGTLTLPYKKSNKKGNNFTVNIIKVNKDGSGIGQVIFNDKEA